MKPLMRRFRLNRIARTTFATYGQLLDEEGKMLAVTLELPWENNAHSISCIPPGEYPAHRLVSPKRNYELFMLDSVPDRSAIELHIGNLPHDTDGCVLLGTAFGTVNGQPGIIESADAFRAFMRVLSGEHTLVLTVTDPPPAAA